jgi:enolase-phosphatase E1
MEEFDAVLLDIEGTITPISFVYDTLFPYAHDHAGRFLKEYWDDLDVQKDVEALRSLNEDDRSAGRTEMEIPRSGSRQAMQAAVERYVHFLMHDDRKETALKSLQGKIWRDGYERGQLRGEFYDDALRALARWNSAGKLIAIYSSGSVEAQQLLFKYASEGDLTHFVSKWFDTTTGPKRESASYEKISEELEIDAERILFATDVLAEAQAAGDAGFQVLMMERLGNPKQPAHLFRKEADFEML